MYEVKNCWYGNNVIGKVPDGFQAVFSFPVDIVRKECVWYLDTSYGGQNHIFDRLTHSMERDPYYNNLTGTKRFALKKISTVNNYQSNNYGDYNRRGSHHDDDQFLTNVALGVAGYCIISSLFD